MEAMGEVDILQTAGHRPTLRRKGRQYAFIINPLLRTSEYLVLEGNADETVHRPSLPSESPTTTSGIESGQSAVIAASTAAAPTLLPPPPPAPIEAIRQNRLTGPTALSEPSTSCSDPRPPLPPPSRRRVEGDTGVGMETQAMDPSE